VVSGLAPGIWRSSTEWATISAALQKFASLDDPFDEWLKERGGRSPTSI
jgi:uncharacterized protein YdaU (DUF1376 family)